MCRCATLQVSGSNNAEQPETHELLLCQQHSLGSSSGSSSDLSHISLLPPPSQPAEVVLDRLAACCSLAADNRSAAAAPSAGAASGSGQAPSEKSQQVSPRRPPGTQLKSVMFADHASAASRSCLSGAAAAAVAAAAADAKSPGCWQAEAGWDSPRGAGAMQGSPWSPRSPGHRAEGIGATNCGAMATLAAEEDLPSTLWLPEFAQFSRPSSAPQRHTHSSPPSVRPSTASRVHNHRSSVLAAAGRSSVVLGGGGLVSSKPDSSRAGAPSIRPNSASARLLPGKVG